MIDKTQLIVRTPAPKALRHAEPELARASAIVEAILELKRKQDLEAELAAAREKARYQLD